MMSFYSLSVSDVKRLTPESVQVSFEIPDSLKSQYSFSQGQFVNLRAEISGEEVVERSYSICSAPYEKGFSVAIKQIENGKVSSWANNALKAGDSIQVSTPMGSFTNELDSSMPRQYLLIAAGSGITPILSILKQVLAAETQSSVVLVYANKTPQSTMFSDQLNALKSKYSSRFMVAHLFSDLEQDEAEKLDVGLSGRLTEPLLDDILASKSLCYSQIDKAFVCGPELMTLKFQDFLKRKCREDADIYIELFFSTQSVDVGQLDVSSSKVQIEIDGDILSFDYEDKTQSILEAALLLDPDLPYGCQNGSCGACQAIVVSGKVSMETNYALSESEVEEGGVLLCQARPESEKVVISYDE